MTKIENHIASLFHAREDCARTIRQAKENVRKREKEDKPAILEFMGKKKLWLFGEWLIEHKGGGLDICIQPQCGSCHWHLSDFEERDWRCTKKKKPRLPEAAICEKHYRRADPKGESGKTMPRG